MVIDLSRFSKAETAIMPLIDGWGSINARKLYFNKRGQQYPHGWYYPDGWYEVSLGETPAVVKPATLLQIRKAVVNKKTYQVYPIGIEGVPVHADTFKRKGFPESVPVYFMQARPFQIAEAVPWECGRFFFKGLTLQGGGDVFKKVGERFENEQSLQGLPGITPEMRYYFLILSLQRQSVREASELEKFALSEKEKQKRIEAFQATFSGRLKKVIEDAGGVLIKWLPQNTGYLIHWRMKDNMQIIKSIVRDDFGIISLGYCASGYDNVHSLSSAIQLAKMYTEESYLNITRT